MNRISELEPRPVWEIFDAITAIPRPSGREEHIAAYLTDFADRHGLRWKKDSAGNVLIVREASPGWEKRSGVILQSHMDMVCEKDSDVAFDFEHDPIRTRIESGWVCAEGTTLGADCGIGMALSLALLTDGRHDFPRIEALFTASEETGLDGALGLENGLLTGKYLINLDSEDEGEIFIGCAGGVDTLARLTIEREPLRSGSRCFTARLSGLLGGHSGDDINKERGNANILLGRFLFEQREQFDPQLFSFEGGNLRNAIPREAEATIAVNAGSAGDLQQAAARYAATLKEELLRSDPDITFTLTEIPAPKEEPFTQALRDALTGSLVTMPNGVLAMSQEIEGFVESSSNLASVKRDGEVIVISTSQRSSVESRKAYYSAAVKAVFGRYGATVRFSDGYPGWRPNPGSFLLERAERTYEELFGKKPVVRAIHAGLECGLILEKYPTLEMISIGPTIRGVHSPSERLDIATVDKCWKHLIRIVTTLK